MPYDDDQQPRDDEPRADDTAQEADGAPCPGGPEPTPAPEGDRPNDPDAAPDAQADTAGPTRQGRLLHLRGLYFTTPDGVSNDDIFLDPDEWGIPRDAIEPYIVRHPRRA